MARSAKFGYVAVVIGTHPEIVALAPIVRMLSLLLPDAGGWTQ